MATGEYAQKKKGSVSNVTSVPVKLSSPLVSLNGPESRMSLMWGALPRGEAFSGWVLPDLFELLLIGPLVVLGLRVRGWRLCAEVRGEGRRYSCHEKHRSAVRRHAVSLEWGLSVLILVQPDVVFVVLLLFIYNFRVTHVIFFHSVLRLLAGGVPVVFGSVDLHTWARRTA